MKKGYLSIVLFMSAVGLHSQTLEEWTAQKKTQKKYMVQQIAALKTYSGYVEKGLAVARKGLQTIQGIKRGDYALHSTYIGALKGINPVVKMLAHIMDLIAIQTAVIKEYKNLQKIKSSSQFSEDEQSYISQVLNKVLIECSQQVDGLFTLVTPDKLEMKDEERLQRIDKLYKAVLDTYVFCKSFSRDVSSLYVNRQHESGDLKMTAQLFQ